MCVRSHTRNVCCCMESTNRLDNLWSVRASAQGLFVSMHIDKHMNCLSSFNTCVPMPTVCCLSKHKFVDKDVQFQLTPVSIIVVWLPGTSA